MPELNARGDASAGMPAAPFPVRSRAASLSTATLRRVPPGGAHARAHAPQGLPPPVKAERGGGGGGAVGAVAHAGAGVEHSGRLGHGGDHKNFSGFPLQTLHVGSAEARAAARLRRCTVCAAHSLRVVSRALPISPALQQPMGREARVLRYKEKRKNRKFDKTIRCAHLQCSSTLRSAALSLLRCADARHAHRVGTRRARRTRRRGRA
jgi:hypothetical protein